MDRASMKLPKTVNEDRIIVRRILTQPGEEPRAVRIPTAGRTECVDANVRCEFRRASGSIETHELRFVTKSRELRGNRTQPG